MGVKDGITVEQPLNDIKMLLYRMFRISILKFPKQSK